MDRLIQAQAELERHRGRRDLKLGELLAIANHLIQLVVPSQPSSRVGETIQERSLRYYVAEGVIDPPLGKEGTAALYGYRHLLQALIVKALQGAYLPMKRIREVLAGKTEAELEAILACEMEILPSQDVMAPWSKGTAAGPELDRLTARNQALHYLDKLAGPSSPRTQEGERMIMEFGVEARQPLNIRDSFSQERSPGRGLPTAQSWERFILEDGIELHVREDRVKGLRGSEIKRMLERLLRLLETRG